MKLWQTSSVTLIFEFMNAAPEEVVVPCSGIEETGPEFSTQVGADGEVARSVHSEGELLVCGVDLRPLPTFDSPGFASFMDEMTGREHKVPIWTPVMAPPDCLKLLIR